MKIKKKIAIVFPSPKDGGVFQYALSITDALINYYPKDFDYYIVCRRSEKNGNFLRFKNRVKFITVSQKQIFFLRKIIHFLGMAFNINLFLIKDFSIALKKEDINLFIFPTPFSFAVPLNLPYLAAIPDLMHKYYSNFPEYSFRNRIVRDIVYGYYARNSLFNVVDSYQGREDLNKFFKIKKDKIKAIYFRPAKYIYKYKDMNKQEVETLVRKYNLPERFIFYPAQFWPHKNHTRLIKALAEIKEKQKTEIPLVLVGSKGGNYQTHYNKLISLAEKLRVRDQIIHLGYVSDKDLVALYKKSLALVFCSLGGPTNIPLVEAMILGTPVLCPDLFEMPKQIGQAGLLFNPFDVNDMAKKIYRIWIDDNLRKKMIEKGYQRARDFTLKSYAQEWKQAIEKAFDSI